MGRNVFVSYSHRLDQKAMEDFCKIFADQREVFVDRSLRDDISHLVDNSIARHISGLIRQCSVTVVLIGRETGGRAWVDWEIYNSLLIGPGRQRSGLLGVLIPNKSHWVPARLAANVPTMGHIIEWPRDYRTLANAVEHAYICRWNVPNNGAPVRVRNS